jgi:HEAT repeat protein
MQLTMQGAKVSAKIEKAPLGKVLAELARQADLTVYITPSDAAQTVSAKFEALPLTEGIKRILQDKSYALITAPIVSAEGKAGGLRVAKVRVLSKGEGGERYTTIKGRQETVPPPQEKDLAKLQRDALEASDAQTRLEALKQLFRLRGKVENAVLAAIVVPALHDAAPEVRGKALSMLHRVMLVEEGALNHLAEVAKTDASPELRSEALRYLAVNPDAATQGHLQQALQDPDERVRKRAERLLSRLQAPEDTTGDGQAQPTASPPVHSQE